MIGSIFDFDKAINSLVFTYEGISCRDNLTFSKEPRALISFKFFYAIYSLQRNVEAINELIILNNLLISAIPMFEGMVNSSIALILVAVLLLILVFSFI